MVTRGDKQSNLSQLLLIDQKIFVLKGDRNTTNQAKPRQKRHFSF